MAFEEAFKELRDWFVGESLRRLDRMTGHLETLAAKGDDAEVLRGLMRDFHGLAGSGGHYGFPLVTSLGRKAERDCLARIQEESPASAEDLARWRRFVTNLRRELSGTPEAVPSLPGAIARHGEVLIVEHDAGLLDRLVSLVEGEGLPARLVRTRGEAVKAIEKRLPAGLLVDIALPDGSGYELIEHLRSFPAARRAPILSLTEDSELLARLEALRCGADVCLSKPLDDEALLRQLRQLMGPGTDAPDRARVLGIQGSPSHVERLQEALGQAGYDLRLCRDPAEVEAEIVDFRPELLLVDAALPGLSGADVVRYVRQDERYTALPALVLGGQSALQTRIEMAKAGVDEYLVAPVDPELLLANLRGRIRRARRSRSLVTRDGLTGAATHQVFIGRARSAIATKQRTAERSFAWLAIDVDGFREINDRHGHVVGDRVLVSLASLLRSRLREEDSIARYGDDEFAVLLTSLQENDAARLASRLLEEFSAIEQRGIEGTPFHASFSAGVAWLEAEMNLESWRKAAGDALEWARAAGGQRVMEYEG